jgi:RNA polymerase sigma-70 factor, ECF subfamily
MGLAVLQREMAVANVVLFMVETPAAGPSRGALSADFGWRLVGALPELHASARRFVDRAEADDLVQETCRRALAAKTSFQSGSDIGAWLYCIMRNIHRDRLRTAGREVLLAAGWDNVASPAAETKPAWMVTSDDALAGAIESLPSPYRETFALHAVEGLRYAEIARRLGIPTSTVGTRLRRARFQIRRVLEGASASTEPRSIGFTEFAPSF